MSELKIERPLFYFKGIVFRDFGVLVSFHMIDMMLVIGQDQVYFSL
jgi:hypothetical protein